MILRIINYNNKIVDLEFNSLKEVTDYIFDEMGSYDMWVKLLDNNKNISDQLMNSEYWQKRFYCFRKKCIIKEDFN